MAIFGEILYCEFAIHYSHHDITNIRRNTALDDNLIPIKQTRLDHGVALNGHDHSARWFFNQKAVNQNWVVSHVDHGFRHACSHGLNNL